MAYADEAGQAYLRVILTAEPVAEPGPLLRVIDYQSGDFYKAVEATQRHRAMMQQHAAFMGGLARLAEDLSQAEYERQLGCDDDFVKARLLCGR